MHSAPVIFLLLLVIKVYSQPNDSVLYQQKAVREPLELKEQLRYLDQLVDNRGTVYLTKDSLIYTAREMRISETLDFSFSYCEIISIEKFQWGGFMPNRIRIITKNQEIVLASFKRKVLVSMARQRIALCPMRSKKHDGK